MFKFNVEVEFTIKAKDRMEAWQKARQICEDHLRGLATVTAVGMEPLPAPQNWIAVNEPINRNRTTRKSLYVSSVVIPIDKGYLE